MTMVLISFRSAVMAVAVGALVLSTAACGVKSSPSPPPDSVYPRQYPQAGAKTIINAPPVQTEKSSKDKGLGTQNPSGAPLSPLGFPLEYPNRSSY